jgi:preprotein translocase subunit YajC
MYIMFGSASAQGQSSWLSFVPIILMIVIFYFLLIRPQQKKEKQRLAMINSLKNGDRVITASGMYGVVSAIKDDVVTIKVASSTNIDFAKNAIQAKIS